MDYTGETALLKMKRKNENNVDVVVNAINSSNALFIKELGDVRKKFKLPTKDDLTSSLYKPTKVIEYYFSHDPVNMVCRRELFQIYNKNLATTIMELYRNYLYATTKLQIGKVNVTCTIYPSLFSGYIMEVYLKI